MATVQSMKPRTPSGEAGGNDMHRGITIEQLIATVARVDAKVEEVRRMYAQIAHAPAIMPVRESANLVSRSGAM
jgi:hypothetical protein